MKTAIVIPARYGSRRLPGKPLLPYPQEGDAESHSFPFLHGSGPDFCLPGVDSEVECREVFSRPVGRQRRQQFLHLKQRCSQVLLHQPQAFLRELNNEAREGKSLCCCRRAFPQRRHAGFQSRRNGCPVWAGQG